MKTIKKQISELVFPERNVRKHNQKQIEEMKRSITQFGQFRPVVIDENNVILAGNGLVMAMQAMGLEEADVIQYTNLNEKQKKKLMIADNQIFTLGSDDMSVIEQFIRELEGDFDVPGYDDETLKMLVADTEEVAEAIVAYGTFDPEEIAVVKNTTVDTSKPVQQTYVAPQEPVQRQGMTPQQYENTAEERTHATTEQYVICPHCGERIYLD